MMEELKKAIKKKKKLKKKKVKVEKMSDQETDNKIISDASSGNDDFKTNGKFEDKDASSGNDDFKTNVKFTDETASFSSDDDFKANIKFEDELKGSCSDATYLAQKMLSQEKLPVEKETKLFNLCIQLEHKVPPQHKIETRAGSHVPSREEIEQFKQIVPLKKGTYSVEEDKIIVCNWKKFCMLHSWDETNPKPFLQLRVGTTTYMRHISQRRKFVQFLANGLPNRTLYSVYHRFKNLYINNIQTRYKPHEDQMIIDHLENNPFLDESRKYADLAKVLQRTRHSIWRRYRILKRRKRKKA